MKITRLRTTLVDVPFERPIATAIHQMHSVGCVVVALETDEGLKGEGLVFTLNGVRLKPLADIIQSFGDRVEGQDPHQVTAVTRAMWDEMNPIGHAGFPVAALSAVDTACWDLVGKAAERPLHHLYGAYRDRIDTYASGGLWLSQSIDDCVEEAVRFVDQGFTAMKIRVGKPDLAEDVLRVREIRNAVGSGIRLLTDANQGLNVKQALALSRRLEEFDIAWLEEPVNYQDLAGHAEIRQRSAIPIASGETCYALQGAHELLKAGAVDVLMPDLQRVGGYSEMRRVAALCFAHHIPFSTHLFTEQSLCIAGSEPACVSVEHMPWFSPLFNESVVLEDGALKIPERPGTGFTLNQEAIRRYAVE